MQTMQEICLRQLLQRQSKGSILLFLIPLSLDLFLNQIIIAYIGHYSMYT